MITEDYVSFEVAKLLKEKGFNGECVMFKDIVEKTFGTEWNAESTYSVPIPTLQMAMKWLRKTHGIDIIIEVSDPVKDRKYYCMIWDGNNNSYILDLFNSHEEACEAAIEYVLENLI